MLARNSMNAMQLKCKAVSSFQCSCALTPCGAVYSLDDGVQRRQTSDQDGLLVLMTLAFDAHAVKT